LYTFQAVQKHADFELIQVFPDFYTLIKRYYRIKEVSPSALKGISLIRNILNNKSYQDEEDHVFLEKCRQSLNGIRVGWDSLSGGLLIKRKPVLHLFTEAPKLIQLCQRGYMRFRMAYDPLEDSSFYYGADNQIDVINFFEEKLGEKYPSGVD
jgi:hypothetical protein